MIWKQLSIAAALLAVLTLAAEMQTVKDISYYPADAPANGNVDYRNERCKLDVCYPDDVKNFPTVIWFHGGGLTGGNKHIPVELKDQKIAVVAVNYRLSGKNGTVCPDYLNDAAAATAWTFKNIAQYGGDPQKIYISGHSAGGYLAAMIAFDKHYLALYGEDPDKLAAIMPVSGQMTTHFRIIDERNAAKPGQSMLQVDEFAPIYHARKDTPPVYLFVGDPAIEFPARVEENAFCAARFTKIAKNTNVKFISFPGKDHGSCIKPSLEEMAKIINDVK